MDTYPRCATCKHWDAPKTVHPCDYNPCVMMAHNGDHPVVEGTLANAFSMEEADAVVFTRSDFGCVMHEPKE